MTIVISTMKELPEHCYDCPLNSSDSYCRADECRRYTQEYRPYWCPLTAIEEGETDVS